MGFSLVEMIVYIAILAIMLGIIMEVVVSITRTERIVESTRNIEDSATLFVERATREIRLAGNINIASSIFNTHPGKLILNNATRTVEFYISGTRIFMKENGVELGALTSSSTRVTSLKFFHSATSTSEKIRVELSLEAGTSTHYRTETFYSTAITR